MKKTRNSIVVGKNRASYDDKHPENPVALRPIHSACKRINAAWLVRKVHGLSKLARPDIARELRRNGLA